MKFDTIQKMKLNEVIKYTRKQKKLTLLKLAEKAGISYGMLYRLEDGDIKNPRPELLKTLSEVLEIEYESLLKKSGYIQKSKKRRDKLVEIPVISMHQLEEESPTSVNKIKSVNQSEKNLVALTYESKNIVPFLISGDSLILKKKKHVEARSRYIIYSKKTGIQVVVARKISDKVCLFDIQRKYIEVPVINDAVILWKIISIQSKSYEANNV